jgi:hypothetical protein
MMEKLSQAGGGGGARPPPFTIIAITYNVAVYAPAEWADIIKEGRAASKSSHYKFGYFLSFPSKQFLPISFAIQLLETFP